MFFSKNIALTSEKRIGQTVPKRLGKTQLKSVHLGKMVVVGLEVVTESVERSRQIQGRKGGKAGDKVNRLICCPIKIYKFIHFIKIWHSIIDKYKTNKPLREKHALFVLYLNP